MEARNLRKERTGVVLSNKMDKTITVAAKFKEKHPIYGKFVSKTKKYHVQVRSGPPYASVGDVIVVSVKSVIPSSDIKKGAVSKALIVRTKKEIRRADGSYIRFDDNACVLLNNAGEIRGSRIFGPVARELRATNMKVVSLAPEVL